MKLAPHLAVLFFKLMDGVQFFVNQRLGLFPEIVDITNYRKYPREKIVKIRDAIYENIHLLDAFVQDNPQNFSDDELATILGWKNYIKGTFYIERFLKPHAIFIDSTRDHVYGVLGISEGFDEMIDKSRLPLQVNTILLPFMGKIIYDGFFHYFSIYFGKGISGNIKEIYLTAKQKNEIITSMDEGDDLIPIPTTSVPVKNWRPELEQLVVLADRLKGGAGQPQLSSPAFSMIKASVEFATLVIARPQDSEKLHKCLKKIERTIKQTQGILYRS